jgi:tRNA 5-methylaminomethyl-2-thiouridine biosynthesis bifunctional protein
VTPRLDAGLGDNAALFSQAFRRARQLYEATPGAVIARGALQRRVGPKDEARFAAISGSDLFEPGMMRLSREGLTIEGALVVDPRALLDAWAPALRVQRVEALASVGEGWSLMGADGESLGEWDVVILACGMDCARLIVDLPLHPVRGQASLAIGAHWPTATLFGSYVIPTRDGLLFGATHDRDDTDSRPRETDHLRNIAAVAETFPNLAADLGARRLEAWTGIRATTRDYLPLAGPAPDAPGLFVLGGLGSRGFTLAPLLAEHLAALVLSAPSPLPRPLADLVDPARFERRARRRGRPSAPGSEAPIP